MIWGGFAIVELPAIGALVALVKIFGALQGLCRSNAPPVFQ